MTTRRSRAVSLTADWENVFGKVQETEVGSSELEREERPPYKFCTGSVYTGCWNAIGLSGFGTYTFPHGTLTYLHTILSKIQTSKLSAHLAICLITMRNEFHCQPTVKECNILSSSSKSFQE